MQVTVANTQYLTQSFRTSGHPLTTLGGSEVLVRELGNGRIEFVSAQNDGRIYYIEDSPFGPMVLSSSEGDEDE